MSYGDMPHTRLAQEMDVVVDAAREFHETYRGMEYWRKPVETTGPKDPFPGHHWRCRTRDAGGEALCNCKALRDGDRLFGRSS